MKLMMALPCFFYLWLSFKEHIHRIWDGVWVQWLQTTCCATSRPTYLWLLDANPMVLHCERQIGLARRSLISIACCVCICTLFGVVWTFQWHLIWVVSAVLLTSICKFLHSLTNGPCHCISQCRAPGIYILIPGFFCSSGELWVKPVSTVFLSISCSSLGKDWIPQHVIGLALKWARLCSNQSKEYEFGSA